MAKSQVKGSKTAKKKSLRPNVGTEARLPYLFIAVAGGFAVSRIRNETQRHSAALESAGQSPIGSLPLDRCRRLGRAIQYHAVDLAALVGDARGDRGEHVVGHARPVGGHGVLRADRAQDDGGAVGALVALDAHRVNVGE